MQLSNIVILAFGSLVAANGCLNSNQCFDDVFGVLDCLVTGVCLFLDMIFNYETNSSRAAITLAGFTSTTATDIP